MQDFQKEVAKFSKEIVNKCYSCGTCSSGCIFARHMDYTPTQIMKAVGLGYKDLCLNSKAIWICASCQTCTTRCPQGIDIAKIIDTLKEISLKEKIKPQIEVKDVSIFHKTFLQGLRLFGREHEPGLVMALNLKTRNFFKDLALGFKLFKKGKVKIFPSISLNNTLQTNKIFSRVKEKQK